MEQFVPQLVNIPWGHNRVIITKCTDVEDALFYVQQTIENNWSRNVLTHQIESGLYTRQGKAITNFAKTLPTPQSDLAQQIIKDPCNFDFLTMSEDFKERELEQGLILYVTKFLIELGAGFAYLGKQVQIQVGERDFFFGSPLLSFPASLILPNCAAKSSMFNFLLMIYCCWIMACLLRVKFLW